jgi:hypothetical protein
VYSLYASPPSHHIKKYYHQRRRKALPSILTAQGGPGGVGLLLCVFPLCFAPLLSDYEILSSKTTESLAIYTDCAGRARGCRTPPTCIPSMPSPPSYQIKKYYHQRRRKALPSILTAQGGPGGVGLLLCVFPLCFATL